MSFNLMVEINFSVNEWVRLIFTFQFPALSTCAFSLSPPIAAPLSTCAFSLPHSYPNFSLSHPFVPPLSPSPRHRYSHFRHLQSPLAVGPPHINVVPPSASHTSPPPSSSPRSANIPDSRGSTMAALFLYLSV